MQWLRSGLILANPIILAPVSLVHAPHSKLTVVGIDQNGEDEFEKFRVRFAIIGSEIEALSDQKAGACRQDVDRTEFWERCYSRGQELYKRLL